MIEKSRTYLDRELRNCFRNKKHAIERNATETEISAISEKISIIQFLLRCVDTVEMVQEEREEDKDELKPCPFCGGKDSGILTTSYDGYWYAVFCENCMAHTRKCRQKKDAVEAWNGRVNNE